MRDKKEIRHCSICQPFDRDAIKYQTDIIATCSVWRENLEVDYSLQESPLSGQTYFVTLNQSVKFSLNMNLWLFYDCPLAYYNGYEKEYEIDQAKFCYGEITRIISYNDLGATVEFKVKNILTFQDILKTRPIQELPDFWTVFFMGFVERNDFTLTKLGKYYELRVSTQGDLGQNCIFTKYENGYFLCKMNEWSFNEDYTFGGKYILPEIIKNKVKLNE